jgi:hypothetical protein
MWYNLVEEYDFKHLNTIFFWEGNVNIKNLHFMAKPTRKENIAKYSVI